MGISRILKALLQPGRIPADLVEMARLQDEKLDLIRRILSGEAEKVRSDAQRADDRLKGNHK